MKWLECVIRRFLPAGSNWSTRNVLIVQPGYLIEYRSYGPLSCTRPHYAHLTCITFITLTALIALLAALFSALRLLPCQIRL